MMSLTSVVLISILNFFCVIYLRVKYDKCDIKIDKYLILKFCCIKIKNNFSKKYEYNDNHSTK